jgi:hypothetical protein
MEKSAKVEKYYNYIVSNILKDTHHEIKGDYVLLTLPWMDYRFSKKDAEYGYNSINTINFVGMGDMVQKHLAGKYGVRDEEMVGVMKRLLTIVYQNIFKDWDSDFLKRDRKPMNESQDKLDRYHNYIVDDMIKNIDFSVTDAVTKIFVNIKLPFMAPKPIPMYFGGVLRWVEPNKSFGKYVIEKYGIESPIFYP